MIHWIPVATLVLAAIEERRQSSDQKRRPATTNDGIAKGHVVCSRCGEIEDEEWAGEDDIGKICAGCVDELNGEASCFQCGATVPIEEIDASSGHEICARCMGPNKSYGAVASWMGGRGPTHTGVAGWMGGRVRTGMYASGAEDEMLNEDRYGMVFAIPIAIEALALAGLALTAVGAVAWVNTDKSGLVRAIEETYAKAAAWATGSAAIAASYQASRQVAYAEATTAVAVAKAAGISIPDKCAWILSPYLIFDHVVSASTPKLLQAGVTEAEILAAADKARSGWAMGNGPLVQMITKLLGGSAANFASGMMTLAGGMIMMFFVTIGTFNLMYIADGIMAQLMADMTACAGKIRPSMGAKARIVAQRIIGWVKNFKLVLFAMRALRYAGPILAVLKRLPLLGSIMACIGLMVTVLKLVGLIDKEDADDIWRMVGPMLEGFGVTQQDIEDMLPGEDTAEGQQLENMLRGAVDQELAEEGALELAYAKGRALIHQAGEGKALARWIYTVHDGMNEEDPIIDLDDAMDTVLVSLSGDAIFEPGDVPDDYYRVAHYLPGFDSPMVLPADDISHIPGAMEGPSASVQTGGHRTVGYNMVRIRQGLYQGLHVMQTGKLFLYSWDCKDGSTRGSRWEDMEICGGGTRGIPEYYDSPPSARKVNTIPIALSFEVIERYGQMFGCEMVAENVHGVPKGSRFIVPCEIPPGVYDLVIDGTVYENDFVVKADRACPIFVNFE